MPRPRACPASTSIGVKTAALAITGGLTAISGILIACQIGSGNGTAATGMELNVIAAVIIGGTSLFGGKGRIWGTLLGVLFLGCINNGMMLINVSEYWHYVVSRRAPSWRPCCSTSCSNADEQPPCPDAFPAGRPHRTAPGGAAARPALPPLVYHPDIFQPTRLTMPLSPT